LISIDTSIFGKLARDYFCDDKAKNQNASETIAYLNENGFVPFISFHHIQEILQHENERVVFRRWSLINKFPIVAWMCSYEDSKILGSIFDIHQLEVKHLLENKNRTFDELISHFKTRLVQYSTGEEFVTIFEPVYCQLRDLGLVDIQRSKEIESLSHVRDKEVDKIKLTQLNHSMLKNPEEVRSYMAKYEKDLSSLLEDKGDSKLKNHKSVASKFVTEVENVGQALYSDSSPSLLEAFVLNSGVRMDQITSKTTVGDLGYLAIYNSKLSHILESLKIPLERARELSPEKHTTWVIWECLDKIMKNENMAHGSNMVDKHMSILALYVDVFTVDKRVKEYFRQLARKKSVLSGYFNNIVKLSSYSDLRGNI